MPFKQCGAELEEWEIPTRFGIS